MGLRVMIGLIFEGRVEGLCIPGQMRGPWPKERKFLVMSSEGFSHRDGLNDWEWWRTTKDERRHG